MTDLAFSDHIEVKRQLTRFYLNLCGNCNIHTMITEVNVHKALANLSKADDDIINRNAVLGFLNLSTEENNHRELLLSGDILTSFLIDLISQDYTQSFNIDFCIQSKRYACLTVGCLLQSNEFDDIFRDNRVVHIISENLQVTDAETQLGISFTLHKLGMKQDMNPLMRDCGLEGPILNFISSGSLATRNHAISSLRRISLDDIICRNIVNKNGLLVLAGVVESVTEEMMRELAATF